MEIPDVLIGRNKQLQDIDDDMKPDFEKTSVISIGMTSGIGKTTMCKYLATKHVNPRLAATRSIGRIIVYDMSRYPAVKHSRDVWRNLIILHLCYIFQGCTVGGIEFKELQIQDFANEISSSLPPTLRKWIDYKMVHNYSCINEWIRLTNIAFKVDSYIRPIFILDDVQYFLKDQVDSMIMTDLIFALSNLTRSCRVVLSAINGDDLNMIKYGTNFLVKNIELTSFTNVIEVNHMSKHSCQH